MTSPQVMAKRKTRFGASVTMTWHGHKLVYNWEFKGHGDPELVIDGMPQGPSNDPSCWGWDNLPKLFTGESTDPSEIWFKIGETAAAAVE